MNCEVCGCTLTGGLDTFGDVGAERCFDCHWGISDEARALAEVEDYERELDETRQELLGVTVEIDGCYEQINALERDINNLRVEEHNLKLKLKQLEARQVVYEIPIFA